MHKTIIIKRAMTGKYDHSGTVIVSQISDQHPDLSLMFPGPGIPRQSGTASEPSDMSLPPECPPREHQGEGLHLVFQTFAENPFLYPGMIVNVIVYVRLRWCVC